MNMHQVLVVDNDENILSAFEDYLSKKNCNMIGVPTAEVGIKKMKLQNFDLLIADVSVASKLETDFIMQAKELQSNLRIIAITSYSDKIRDFNMKINGADYLFIKPLELKKLNKAVDRCLKQSQKQIS
ncbi:MAG: response regulator [Ignavibacteriaceae bacterium]